MYYNSFDYPASSGFSRPDVGETTARRVSFDKIKMKIQLQEPFLFLFNLSSYTEKSGSLL